MVNKFRLKTRLPRNFQGSLTCHKSATWDRQLYFPSEGRRAEDFFSRKIRRLQPDLNPRSWVPEASTLDHRSHGGGSHLIIAQKCYHIIPIMLLFLPIILLFLYGFCFNLYCGGFILFCTMCVCVCVCVYEWVL